MAFLVVVIFGAPGIQNAVSQSTDEADKISVCESKHREFLRIGDAKFVARYAFTEFKYCASMFKHFAWDYAEPQRSEELTKLISYLEGESLVPTARNRPAEYSVIVPSWIKTDAKLWYTGEVTDSKFAYSIRHMITSKIVIPSDGGIQFEELRIPSWFKNTSQWWVEGLITAPEYVYATEYLIDKNIIRV